MISSHRELVKSSGGRGVRFSLADRRGTEFFRRLIMAQQDLTAFRFGRIHARLSVSYELDQGSTVGKITLNSTRAIGTAGCIDCSVRTSRHLDLGRGPHGSHGSVRSIRVV